ncbi:MAG: hypothetical protein MZW92_11210 [Comamonadaceae bacterium]|nr:hypothetical protein [Comamonadaceae bacterium]
MDDLRRALFDAVGRLKERGAAAGDAGEVTTPGAASGHPRLAWDCLRAVAPDRVTPIPDTIHGQRTG